MFYVCKIETNGFRSNVLKFNSNQWNICEKSEENHWIILTVL